MTIATANKKAVTSNDNMERITTSENTTMTTGNK